MISILRSNGALRRLLGVWLQSCLGSGAGYVALLALTYRYLHHSPWAVTGVLLADFVPAIAFGAAFGGLADRHSRRTLIVVANVVQAAAWGGLVFVHTAVPILGLALLSGLGNALQRPAMRSALPVVAGEAQQVAAAWFDTSRWIGITVGPLVAAGAFALWGVKLPLALNAVSFLVAAAVIATISIDRQKTEHEHTDGPGGGLRAGLAAAFAAPGIAAVIGCSAAAVISGGLLNVCEPLLAMGVLHGSHSDYALLVACYGVGMVAGSALVARRGAVAGHLIIRRYLASLLLSGLGMAGSAIVGSVGPATIAFAATGYANALLVVSETQLIQLRVPNAVQGRLFGAKDTVEGAFYVIGLVGASILISAGGVRLTLASGAGLYAVCGIAAIVLLGLLPGATGRRATAVADASWEAGGRRRFDPSVATAGAREDAEPVREPSATVSASPPRP